MTNIALFKRLLEERFNTLGELSLKARWGCPNNELHMLIEDALNTVELQEDASAIDNAKRVIDTTCAFLSDENAPERQVFLNTLIEGLANKIRSGMSELSEYQKQAGSLAQLVSDRFTALCANDPFLREHCNIDRSKAKTELMDIPWQVINNFAPDSVIVANINDKVLAPEAERRQLLDMPTFHIAAAKFQYESFVNLEDTEAYPKTTHEEISKVINDKLCDMHGKDPKTTRLASADIVSMLTSKKHFSQYIMWIRNHREKPEELVWGLLRTLEFIGDGREVLECAEVVQTMEVSDYVKDAFTQNGQLLRNAIELEAYYALVIRASFLKDAYLVQGGYINRDNDSEFSEAGGDTAMLATYIHVMHKGDVATIPVSGVSAKMIVESASKVEQVAKESESDISQRVMIASNRYKSEAFSHETRTMEGDEAVIRAMCTALQVGTTTIDAAAMQYVMSKHVDSFAHILWTKFGNAYAAKLTEGGKLDEASIDLVETGVLIDMLVEFILGDGKRAGRLFRY